MHVIALAPNRIIELSLFLIDGSNKTIKDHIHNNYDLLVRAVHAPEITDHLVAKHVITREQQSEIRGETDRRQQMRDLLDLILDSCHPKSGIEFVNSLQKSYRSYAEKLTKGFTNQYL